MSLNRIPSIFKRPTQQNVDTVPSGLPQGSSSALSAGNSAKVFSNFREAIRKDLPVDLSVISAVIDALRHTEAIDDRKLLLEHALVFISRLDGSPLATKLQDKVVELLYNDLAHPPSTYLGTNDYKKAGTSGPAPSATSSPAIINNAWRSADGSGNNIDLPGLGRSGAPYARSVQQSHPLPKNALPDPGLIFDTLLRREGFVEHPAGLSSLMFAFAALVIHSVFRTSHTDFNINETSSYVDLSPLYGHNQATQDKVRKRDGYGTLYPDVFAEDRLLLLPPAVCSLLILFNRNHNYIVKKLLEINEKGTFVNPTTLSPSSPQLLAQEEELFQTARLINCGWFGSVIFSDYFSSILGLVRQGSSWSLNPFGEIRNLDHSVFERGKGNVCSVEFNCLYRWHATTSVQDQDWAEKVFNQVFDGKTPDQVKPHDFRAAAAKLQAMEVDITHWTFGHLQRQEDGTFKDEELANIIQNATESPAAAFRARGTPAVMRLHEIMGIEQNRQWGVCSLNDFRKYLGLKPYASFMEWNPDPAIAEAAEKLYGDINHLELYVGLQAEETKHLVEGAGLCPGYTISRAILSDAIALTRGDRFFTADYTPHNLTTWGFADCQKDPSGTGFGSTLGRLLLRTLPQNFTSDSVYTWFPLMTPNAMQTYLTKLGVIDKYDLSRPKTKQVAQTIKDYAEVAEVLEKPAVYKTSYAAHAAKVVKGKGFFIATGDPLTKEYELVSATLGESPGYLDKIGRFFYDTTRQLVKSCSYTLVGSKTNAVDIVRDVLPYVPLYWVTSEVAGIQLKTKEHPHGTYTPSQLHDILGDIYSFVFLDTEPSRLVVLQDRVESHIDGLLQHIKNHLNATAGQRLSIAGLVDTVSQIIWKQKKPERQELAKRLYELSHSTDQLANSILAIMVGSTVELSLSLTNILNLYLGSDKEDELRAVLSSSDAKFKATVNQYIYEGLRLDPPLQGFYCTTLVDQTLSGRPVPKGAALFLDIADASLNERVFPEPERVDVSRTPKERYLAGGHVSRCLGDTVAHKIMAEVLRAIFELDNLRRAPGQSGVLKRFKDSSKPAVRWSYLDQNQFPSPWPTSMVVQYDI